MKRKARTVKAMQAIPPARDLHGHFWLSETGTRKRKQHASSLRYLSLGWDIMEHIFEVSNKSAWLPMLQVSVPAIAAVDPHKAAAAGIKPEFYDSVHDTLVALKAAGAFDSEEGQGRKRTAFAKPAIGRIKK